MVLRGEQIQRCGPAECNLCTNLALPNEIAWLPRDRTRVRTQCGAHAGPASQRIVPQDGQSMSAAYLQTLYPIARARRRVAADRTPNGPRQKGGRYVEQVHHR